jgi:hypothetical protein
MRGLWSRSINERTTAIKKRRRIVVIGGFFNDRNMHVRSNCMEATASGWKPGPNLVGKVWIVWKTDMTFD